MPTFVDVDRRLVLRYADPDKSTFNFAKLRTNAANDGMHRLATAIASVQREQPSMITTVLTRQLMI